MRLCDAPMTALRNFTLWYLVGRLSLHWMNMVRMRKLGNGGWDDEGVNDRRNRGMRMRAMMRTLWHKWLNALMITSYDYWHRLRRSWSYAWWWQTWSISFCSLWCLSIVFALWPQSQQCMIMTICAQSFINAVLGFCKPVASLSWFFSWLDISLVKQLSSGESTSQSCSS